VAVAERREDLRGRDRSAGALQEADLHESRRDEVAPPEEPLLDVK
jgi:hypothetical protein